LPPRPHPRGQQLIAAAITPLPPPQRSPPTPAADVPTTPVRVGFIVLTFSFGGSETETIELVQGCDPTRVQFTAIAVGRPQPLPEREPPRDGSFPPILMPASVDNRGSDPRITVVESFAAAIATVVASSDIVLSWGVANLGELLPAGRLPKIVILSKDSGAWAESFLHPNSLLTSSLVANSTTAVAAFPDAVQPRVTVIHDGINPRRVAVRVTRDEQRRGWGIDVAAKVVGYLGRIEYDKGVDRIVDAVACLPPDWKVVFVGANPNSRYAVSLRAYCEQTITDRYRLLEWTHDVGSVLGGFDVFCQPSDHEGFSNSLGEAWLAGVPTVYTAGTGAIPDVGELGIPVAPGAAGPEIAVAIERAWCSNGLAQRAQEVMRRRFLISENVQQWTNYLTGLHREELRARVLFLFPADLVGSIVRWLAAVQALPVPLEVCCIVAEGVPRSRLIRGPAEYVDGLVPLFVVPNGRLVSRLVTFTRPDFIVTFQHHAHERLLPLNGDVPVLLVPRDPVRDGMNWTRWICQLALARGGDVHK
jgi:glycosyltransferase involved in cell wall biosynthesis